MTHFWPKNGHFLTPFLTLFVKSGNRWWAGPSKKKCKKKHEKNPDFGVCQKSALERKIVQFRHFWKKRTIFEKTGQKVSCKKLQKNHFFCYFLLFPFPAAWKKREKSVKKGKKWVFSTFLAIFGHFLTSIGQNINIII